MTIETLLYRAAWENHLEGGPRAIIWHASIGGREVRCVIPGAFLKQHFAGQLADHDNLQELFKSNAVEIKKQLQETYNAGRLKPNGDLVLET